MKLDLRKKQRPNLSTGRSFFFTWMVFGVLFGSPSVYYIVTETIIPLNFRSIISYYLDGYEVILNVISSAFEPLGHFVRYCLSLIDIDVEYSDRWVPLFVISSLAFLCVIRGIVGITKRYDELPLALAGYASCFVGCFMLGFINWGEGNVFWHALLSLAPFGLLSIPFLILGSTILNLYARFQHARYKSEVQRYTKRQRNLHAELEQIEQDFKRHEEHAARKKSQARELEWARDDDAVALQKEVRKELIDAEQQLAETRQRRLSASSLLELAHWNLKQDRKAVGEFEAMKNTTNIGSTEAVKAILAVYLVSLILCLVVINVPVLSNNPSVVLIIIQMLVLSCFFLFMGLHKDSSEVIHFALMLQGSILGVFILFGLDRLLPAVHSTG